MRTLLRALVAFIVFVATNYFVFWLPCSLLHLHDPWWVATGLSLACAVAAAWFVWRASAALPHGLCASVLAGALALGGIGFVAGFFGPILLAPDANQGPLLGIFVTGPASALLGGLGGLLHWCIRGKQQPPA